MNLLIILSIAVVSYPAIVLGQSASTKEYQKAYQEYSRRLDQSKGKLSPQEKENLKKEVFSKANEVASKERKEANLSNNEDIPKVKAALQDAVKNIKKNPNEPEDQDASDKTVAKSPPKIDKSIGFESNPAVIKQGSKNVNEVKISNSQSGKSTKSSSQQRVNSTTSGTVEAGGAESISFSK